MNSLFFSSSLLLPPPSSLHHHNQSPLRFQFPLTLHHRSLSSSLRSLCTSQSNEGTISVLNFDDFIEKDWSFLDSDNLNSLEEQNSKANLIISEGQIQENSRVLVSIATEEFVDRLVGFSNCKVLLVVHDSLFVLAGIKEKHDGVKCWQGEIVFVPEKWAPFDVVYLCYLPALPFELDQIFGEIAKRCLQGARLVISFPQGRGVVEQQRKEFPDVVISDLPDKMTLEKVAAKHSFEITKFLDEPGFYLAVMKFCGVGC